MIAEPVKSPPDKSERLANTIQRPNCEIDSRPVGRTAASSVDGRRSSWSPRRTAHGPHRRVGTRHGRRRRTRPAASRRRPEPERVRASRSTPTTNGQGHRRRFDGREIVRDRLEDDERTVGGDRRRRRVGATLGSPADVTETNSGSSLGARRRPDVDVRRHQVRGHRARAGDEHHRGAVSRHVEIGTGDDLWIAGGDDVEALRTSWAPPAAGRT